jgi:hypothetical protein
MQSRFQRALGVAVVMALASPVPAMAQETFLRCPSMIISFNPTTQAIYQYDADGDRLRSLCRLPDSETLYSRNSRTIERTIHTYSDLRCSVGEAEITVRDTWNRRNEWKFNGLGDDFRPSRNQFQPETDTGLRINRRSGSFYYNSDYTGNSLSGTCEAIQRPTPRPNRF